MEASLEAELELPRLSIDHRKGLIEFHVIVERVN